MSSAHLYLTQMTLDPAALVRFAAHNGLARARDDDHGYALHAWLAAMFADHAPKPFRLLDGYHAAPLTLLAYGDAPGPALARQAKTFAEPLAYSVLTVNSLASKAMPMEWPPGTRLRIDVLACPVRRRDGVERDAYLRALTHADDAIPTRSEVYASWLREQFAGAVEVSNVRLTGFSRTHLARRSRPGPTPQRPFHMLERPCARFSTLATIRDGTAFMTLLRRGVGRHRAFGFGMLLLRPPA